MARIGEGGDLAKCSFCGKSHRHVRRLIAGPDVYICDQCVELCSEILHQELYLDLTTPATVDFLEELLEDWVDDFDPEDAEEIEKAKLVLGQAIQELTRKTTPAEEP